MIPTTASSSPSSSVTMSTSGGGGVQSATNSVSSAIIGIASLVLEGRAVADYYQNSTPRTTAVTTIDNDVNIMGGGNAVSAGRYSPKPSTSRAAVGVASSSSGNSSCLPINITTNPYAFNISTSGGSGSSFADLQSTHQRWTQKLCQLRQVSPAGSLSSNYEQKIAIETVGEPELVSLAINNDNSSDRSGGDFEIIRRVLLNRANLSQLTATTTSNAGSAASSPGSGSENFLHSLQSLATTCLRGSGSPHPVEASYRVHQSIIQNCDIPTSPSSTGGSGFLSPHSSGSPLDKHRRILHSSNLINMDTPISTAPTTKLAGMSTSSSSSLPSSSSSNYPQQGPHCDQFLRKMGLAKGETIDAEDHICDISFTNISCTRWLAYCQKIEAIIARGDTVCIEVYLGPVSHKILLEQWIFTQKEKVTPPTMSLPSLCSAIRSQLYFSQISAWCDLIKKSDKSIYDTGRIIFHTPTGAAGDLATSSTSSTLPPAHTPHSTFNTTTDGSGTPSPGSSPSVVAFGLLTSLAVHATNTTSNRKPRLNIFYRIKQYDSTACFKSKPNVHNFPNVNISENCSIAVCLKSLPRINGGIPKIVPNMPSGCDVSVESNTNFVKNSAISSCSAVEMSRKNRTKNVCAEKRTSQTQPSASSSNTAIASSPTLPTTSSSSSSNPPNCDKVTPSIDLTTKQSCEEVKQKRMFFIDEEELDLNGGGHQEDIEAEVDDGDTSTQSSTNDSFSGSSNMSHREKQLMKYRKHMQKRDKKKDRKCPGTGDTQMSQQPMEESVVHSSASAVGMRDVTDSTHIEMISTGTQTPLTCCQQCGSEKTLLCLNCRDEASSVSVLNEMESTCSISSSDIIHTPRNKAELLLQAIQRTPKAAKQKHTVCMDSSKSLNNNHSNGSAASLSLSFLSRNSNGCHECKRQKTQHNFTAIIDPPVALGEDVSLCSVDEGSNGQQQEDNENGDSDGGICYQSQLCENNSTVIQSAYSSMEQESFVSSTKLTPHIERCSLSPSTKVTKCQRSCTPPNMGVDLEASFKTPTTDNNWRPHQQTAPIPHKHTPKPNLLQISCHYTNSAGDGLVWDNDVNNVGYSNTNTTPSNYHHSHHIPLLMRKGLPKVNLTPIFCNPHATNSLSSPIPITCPPAPDDSMSFNFEPHCINQGQHQQQHCRSNGKLSANQYTPEACCSCDNNNIPVQKSFSAPTLPHSPSLSPRFAKAAAIYKRRSRHLSDRSDRSSLGSDEQFSDEDCESPATSPMKQRSRIAASFGRLPLLGNLEESLLQKRLLPKIEVMGYKVLLGASGGFCPNQLTIPASAYFYELYGETLSTPYVCDVRLPRKGYSVPRTGTVQATLLNPMGTVVRMFVIPYDMRDMPPLHQTFIRQRILAEASINESTSNNNNNHVNNNHNSINRGAGDFVIHPSMPTNDEEGNKNVISNNNNKYRISPSGGLHGESNLGHFISAEHMKRLRYSIHLRFQTSRSGRLLLHSDIRLLISRRTDCDTAAAHAKGVLEAPNDLVTDTVMPSNPKYSARQDSQNKI